MSTHIHRQRAVTVMAASILTLAPWMLPAQQTVAQCEAQCTTDCKDRFFGKSAVEACIAGCPAKCTPTTVRGQIHPKYLILAIVYAPPGCTSSAASKCAQSKVTYGSSSSIGTKLSASTSFKSGEDISVGVGGGNTGGDVTLGGGFSLTTTDSTTETITKTQGSEISAPSIQDGVDHDLDTFFLLVNPVVNVAQQGNSVSWNLGFSGPFGVLQTISVSELKNPSTMPASVAQTFAKLGFTSSDFQTILSQDPFAAGGSVDPNRYVPTTLSFPYEPPSAADCANGQCACFALQQSISNQLANEVSQTLAVTYSVSLSSGISIPGLVSLKNTNSFSWTDQASIANTTSNSQTASAQIQCPSPNYTGLTAMAAYWDALYGTFAFVPFDPSAVPAIQRGILTNSAGQPVRGEALTLVAGGLTYRTVSGKNGTYQFLAPWAKGGSPTGTGLLQVKGVRQTVPLGPTPARIRLP